MNTESFESQPQGLPLAGAEKSWISMGTVPAGPNGQTDREGGQHHKHRWGSASVLLGSSPPVRCWPSFLVGRATYGDSEL